MGTMEQYQVRDGSRQLAFDGALLGHVTSQRHGSPRWMEMTLYKTVGGSYVLEKVGRSVMCHTKDCTQPPPNWSSSRQMWVQTVKALPRFEDEHPGDDPDDGYWFDDSCVGEYYDITDLRIEADRYWAVIAEDPAQVVDALYRRKAGARQLPRASLELLDMVSREDQAIADVFRVERIS